ncbi:MAG: NAD(P)H-dependent oxidoreductase [Oscillibacter ruminantium]|uniref:NAD(P)H-dependent oxidoreductase n=1 Tax=Oscillibacter ruminantium TaxID=1263547 RepID=UPI002B2098B4|nr:NAD(P)H-dependent oxidoreductase [Oscillibacter ruminantium]MEA5041511.1 NAD(P)H-dependent oxidoreductase [Oscillibacter ruminantium]
MLTLICPGKTASQRYALALRAGLNGIPCEILTRLDGPLENRAILFAVPLDESGVNHEYYDLLAFLRTHPVCLYGCVGGVMVDGPGDLYTKAAARELVLAANMAGCTFPGRPLVEAIGSLANFAVQAKLADCDLETAYHLAVRNLAGRILDFSPPRLEKPNLLVLHASNHATSNTLALWGAVRKRLGDACTVTEIGLRNGTLEDCRGCPYTACLHFGEKGGCFYGGVIVENVYPAVRQADGVILLCPNYNDAVSANLTAAINRLTALYRTTSFSGKALFGIVVSGYSGGDIVARQLVGALCMNKGFYLPPGFCMLETANDAGAAMKLPGIEERLDEFAENLLHQLKG